MISSGTDEYISRIVDTYSQTLFRAAFAVLRCAPEAEDAVQETFIKLLRARPDFGSPEHEKAWLIRVAVNTSRNRLKKLCRRGASLDDCCDLPAPQQSREVLDAVLALPEKYRTVIHLYYYEGYSIAEIASILTTPAATVGTRLSRARRLLKTMLEGDDEE